MGTLGQTIKKLRIDRRMAQKDLQAQVGISQKQLSAIELDKVEPKWTTVVRIAAALRVPLDELAKSNGGGHA
jgi:DNA-binding XRE family transcriptional regulator